MRVLGRGRSDAAATDRWATATLVVVAAGALVPSAVSSVVAPERIEGAEIERIVRAAFILAFVVLVAVQLLDTYRSKSGPPGVRNGALVVALLVFWLVGMASLLWNSRSLPQLSALAIPLIILGIAMYGGGPRLALRVLEYCLLAVCYASLALALLYPRAAFPSGTTFEASRVLGFLTDERLAGIVRHPNNLALLAAAAIVLVVVRRGRFWPIHLLVATSALLLSESRATVASLLLTLGVLGLVLKTTTETKRIRLTHVVATSIWSVIVLLPVLAAADLLSVTLNGRTLIWDYALSRVGERPLLGFGPGVWTDFTAAGDLRIGSHGHNQFVESLTTVGVLGLASVAVIAVLWLRSFSPHRTSETVAAVSAFVLVWAVAVLESPVTLWGMNPLSWLLIMLTVACLGRESSSRELHRPDDERCSLSPHQAYGDPRAVKLNPWRSPPVKR